MMPRTKHAPTQHVPRRQACARVRARVVNHAHLVAGQAKHTKPPTAGFNVQPAFIGQFAGVAKVSPLFVDVIHCVRDAIVLVVYPTYVASRDIRISEVLPMPDTRVQTLLDELDVIVFPGVYDALSAKIAQRAGFPLSFISGYSVSASLIGEPDMGFLTQMEMIDRARQVCLNVNIPIIVDADTGYGNPLNVIRTVNELIVAGAAGCFLEDQVWPKKCGHMRGKRVIDREEYIDKIRAANEARGGRDFFIVSRTDALAPAGMDEAVARMHEAREAGANASFIEAPGSKEQMRTICANAPKPNVANMIEGGKTPVLPKAELADIGYQLILHPLAGLYAAAQAIEDVYSQLKANQTTLGADTALMQFEQFNGLIGVEDRYHLAERFGVKS